MKQPIKTDRDAKIVRTSVVGILANVFLAAFKAVVGLTANSMLPGIVHFPDHISPLLLREIPAAELLPVHPVEGGPLIREIHLPDVVLILEHVPMIPNDPPAVVSVDDRPVPYDDRLIYLAVGKDVVPELAVLFRCQRWDGVLKYGIRFYRHSVLLLTC